MNIELWSWMVANGPGVSATAAGVTAFSAIFALWSGARDVESKSRPMVVAEFRPVDDARGFVELVVRNAGPSIGRHVVVTFRPAIELPEEASPGEHVLTSLILKRYEKPIPTFAPGQELRNIWYAARAGEGDKLVNAEPTPDRITIEITYRGRRRRTYRDTFELDVDLIRTTTFAQSSSSMPGRVKTISESSKKISESLAKIASQLGRMAPKDEE